MNTGDRYPLDVIEFNNCFGPQKRFHPTQKPVDLLDYLITTYTLPGETVLDNTMGSGSTGVACALSGRNFIGYEMSPEFFEIAKRRISEAQNNLFNSADGEN